jgi:hypothetical protein
MLVKELTGGIFCMETWMATVSFNGKTVIFTKVSSKIIKSMDSENITVNRDIIKECIRKGRDADKEK